MVKSAENSHIMINYKAMLEIILLLVSSLAMSNIILGFLFNFTLLSEVGIQFYQIPLSISDFIVPNSRFLALFIIVAGMSYLLYLFGVVNSKFNLSPPTFFILGGCMLPSVMAIHNIKELCSIHPFSEGTFSIVVSSSLMIILFACYLYLKKIVNLSVFFYATLAIYASTSASIGALMLFHEDTQNTLVYIDNAPKGFPLIYMYEKGALVRKGKKYIFVYNSNIKEVVY